MMSYFHNLAVFTTSLLHIFTFTISQFHRRIADAIASWFFMVVLNIDTSFVLETPGGFRGGPQQRHQPEAGDSW